MDLGMCAARTREISMEALGGDRREREKSEEDTVSGEVAGRGRGVEGVLVTPCKRLGKTKRAEPLPPDTTDAAWMLRGEGAGRDEAPVLGTSLVELEAEVLARYRRWRCGTAGSAE